MTTRSAVSEQARSRDSYSVDRLTSRNGVTARRCFRRRDSIPLLSVCLVLERQPHLRVVRGSRPRANQTQRSTSCGGERDRDHQESTRLLRRTASPIRGRGPTTPWTFVTSTPWNAKLRDRVDDVLVVAGFVGVDSADESDRSPGPDLAADDAVCREREGDELHAIGGPGRRRAAASSAGSTKRASSSCSPGRMSASATSPARSSRSVTSPSARLRCRDWSTRRSRATDSPGVPSGRLLHNVDVA